MNQHGFSLLEIIVAIVLSGLIMMVLITGFSQFVSGVGFMDRAMQLQTKRIIIARTLRRDLSGLFVPACVLHELRKVTEPETKTSQAGGEAMLQGEKKEEGPKQANAEMETVPVLEGYLFKATGPGDTLNELRFYSYNALQGYWTEKVGTVKTRVMEVHYELKEAESSNGTPLYTLVRRERIAKPCMPADKQKKLGREVVIASGVVRMSGKFITIKQPEKTDEQTTDKEQPPQVLPLDEVSSFAREPKKIIEQLRVGDKKIPSLLPDAISLTITLQDTAGVEHDLSLFVYVPVHPRLNQESSQLDTEQQSQIKNESAESNEQRSQTPNPLPHMQVPL